MINDNYQDNNEFVFNNTLKFDKGTLINEDNADGDIDTTVTVVTLDNDNIHILNDRSREYIDAILGITVNSIKNRYTECNKG